MKRHMNSSLDLVLFGRRILNVDPDAPLKSGPHPKTNDLPGRRVTPGPHDLTLPVIRGGHHLKLPTESELQVPADAWPAEPVPSPTLPP